MVKSPAAQKENEVVLLSSSAAAASSEKSCYSCTSSSSMKYKGVRKRKWGKYVSEIRLPNSRARIWLGSYDTAEKAAKAFDAALYCLRGKAAKFNFPNNPPEIVNGRNMTSAEIQVAAARFANSDSKPGQSRVEELVSGSVSDNSSMSSDVHHVESPCQSVSDGAIQLDGELPELPLDNAFLDTFSTMGWDSSFGSGTYNVVPDFGIYPGFDDFFVSPIPVNDDSYGEENYAQDSNLWNF